MKIKQVQGYLREIDTVRREIKIENLGKLYPYAYNDNVKPEELERQLGEFVKLILRDDVLTQIS